MAVVSVCLNLPWTEVNPYMSRSMVLFGLLIGIANGCNTFGADSIYGKHHDVEFEDIRIQSDYLKIIALQKDSLVKRTTLTNPEEM